MDRRIIFSDKGVLTDYSAELCDYNSGSASIQMVALEDAIYIGSRLPFNNTYIKIDAGNTSASVLAIEYWDGSEFRDVVNIVDETITSGKTLSKSGFISWTPSKDYGYSMDDTENVDGLGTAVTIYDMYWTRLTVSADFTSATTLSWIGSIFSNDADLGSEFPDLVVASRITSISSTKTNYEEQAVRAAEIITNDLIGLGTIKHGEQILDRSDFKLPSVQKVAEIIFKIFGEDYDKDRVEAVKEYNSRLKKAFPKVDKNNDARESPSERNSSFGVMTR